MLDFSFLIFPFLNELFSPIQLSSCVSLSYVRHGLFFLLLSDCIGSAFNSKGAMQCPNCRKVEKGQWLYAGGYRPLSEFSMDDWAHDEDLYDLSYSEMVKSTFLVYADSECW